MYIPAGTWKGAANGSLGDLNINFETGTSGAFTGTAFGHPIRGRWQAGPGSISFATTDGSSQLYKGYLVFPQNDVPQHALYTLTGTFDDLSGAYGWFAQVSIVP